MQDSERYVGGTPHGASEKILLSMAWVWVTVAKNAHVIVMYTVAMIVVGITIGVVDPRLAELTLVYLVMLPLGLVACVMGVITAVLGIVGSSRV